MTSEEMALRALYKLHRDNPEGLNRLAMAPYFPDCYDQWSLIEYQTEGGHLFDMIFEGTEQQCRDYAYENFSESERKRMSLMDWEARESDL
jgi:hypothetical protein